MSDQRDGDEGGLTYRNAGVDVDAGDRLVDRIRPLAARTRIPELLAGVGGFAGLCRVPADVEDPILVSGTDGVGTKLKVAFATGVHDTIGIDLVAMCVNDVVTSGARPLFFLDYFGTGALDEGVAARVVAGIATGCEQAGCALLGGETAELPGMYAAGEYDLAGFAVGVVGQANLIDGAASVEPGDVLLGVASSGMHSNGYSLARKALLELGGLAYDDHVDALGGISLGQALLEPTRIYARAVLAAVSAGTVHGICHVTGGGLPGNLPRVLPPGVVARVSSGALPRPPIFDLVAETGGVAEAEMRRTFNLGVGLVLAVPPASVDAVQAALTAAGETAAPMGSVAAATHSDAPAEVVYEDDETGRR